MPAGENPKSSAACEMLATESPGCGNHDRQRAIPSCIQSRPSQPLPLTVPACQTAARRAVAERSTRLPPRASRPKRPTSAPSQAKRSHGDIAVRNGHRLRGRAIGHAARSLSRYVRAMTGPLTGYRIIEVAGIGPGPFTAMMLADMGADVVRIDRAVEAAAATYPLGRSSRSSTPSYFGSPA
jgi:hypothetical protein